MDFLEEKDLNDFSFGVKNIFNLMTISGHYRVIGSAILKKIKYSSDYDLDEIYKKNKDSNKLLKSVYNLFKNKYITAKHDKNIFIMDFKCGEINDEPIRWNYKTMMKGYQMIDGKKYTFEECLIQKSTIKLDIIALIDGVFTEFSENYYIKLGDDSNFKESEMTKDKILNSLKESFKEEYKEKNYLKALKRSFAYKLLDNPKKYYNELKKMINYFNSKVGIINKARADLDILILILDNEFRKPNKQDIENNFFLISDTLKQYNLFNNLTNKILILLNKPTFNKSSLLKSLNALRDKLFILSNKITLDYIFKNKNLLI